MRKLLAAITATILLLGCDGAEYPVPEPEELPKAVTETVSFETDIRPIVETKCIACHACFDAPCQLKMESASGLVRGSSISEVYNGTRTESQQPTRLGIDADNEADWRALDFYSVLQAHQDSPALMAGMLKLGKQYPFEANSKLPDAIKLGTRRENQCPAPEDFADYAEQHPLEGMPLAVAGLTDNEYALMAGWLKQGAKIDSTEKPLSHAEQQAIDDWETYLNQTGKRRQLVARWFYEHLFLAHLYFDTAGPAPRFFELLRSKTPTGEPIQPINTRLPNDDPGGKFYYRIRPVDGSIVHKRHITLQFGKTLQKRIETLFFDDNWSVETLPGYAYADRANPFMTFAAIPAKARYQFMLDHAEYFTRTFIRGPVCRGQIATDEIRDEFWGRYEDPARDVFLCIPQYRVELAP